MVRSIASISAGIALSLSAAAAAQSVPTGPLPGTGDSTKISSGNRSANAEYNHLIGAGDAKAQAQDNSRSTAKSSSPVPATAADLTVGSNLRDIKGARIGTVSQVDPDGVVVDTGTTKIKVPTSAFGKDSQGLMLGITADKFNELIAKAHASH